MTSKQDTVCVQRRQRQYGRGSKLMSYVGNGAGAAKGVVDIGKFDIAAVRKKDCSKGSECKNK